ncbi:S1 family peptidase [Streptosporangium canum]|uniref:S1 family peptidase n=1 Tax=Streptosporangium canum TaxID=324952 RepID=UPI003423F805
MSRRHVIAPGCVLTITALTLTLAVAPAAATRPAAQTSGTPAAGSVRKPPPGMVQALQRDLRLNRVQAETRLLNEARLTPIEASLRRRIGDRFAGAWFAGNLAQVLVVATTDPADPSLITALDARPLVVGRSLLDLEAVKAKVDAALAHDRAARVRYIDVRTNKVVILSAKAAETIAILNAADVDPAAVQVVTSDEQPRPLYDLIAGDRYYVGATTRCSAGFSVTKGAQNGFVSAGHCGKPGSATVGFNRRPQGIVKDSAFPGDDFSWVAVNNDWTPQPLVGNGTGGTMSVSGRRSAVEGSSVCRFGSISGWHCGTIQQRDTSVTYPQGVVDHLTRTTVCAEPGDSGGPFISIEQAQGITSGGSGNCTSGGFTYFQPISEILTAYGLTLTTVKIAALGPGSCTSYPRLSTGTLNSRQSVYWPHDHGFVTTATGTYSACLPNNPGRDYDLYLEKWNGKAWSTVAASESPSSYEQIDYFGTPGRYRYRVYAESGSGPYALGHDEP